MGAVVLTDGPWGMAELVRRFGWTKPALTGLVNRVSATALLNDHRCQATGVHSESR